MKRLLISLAILGLVAVGCGESPTRTDVAARGDTPSPSMLPLAGPSWRTEAAHALRVQLAEPPTGLAADKQLWSMVTSAYGMQTDMLLWVDRKGPRANLAQLRQAFVNAAADGLDPARYDLSAVDALLPQKSGLLGARLEPATAAEADVRITLAAVRLARDLRDGVTLPEKIDRHWVATSAQDVGAVVARAAGSRDVEAGLRTLAPQHPQYARLREALAHHRALAQQGPWPAVPETLKVKKPGDVSPAIPALRARLAASGHLATAQGDDRFDAGIEQAVRQFQREQGLEDDGVPGKSTLAALNVPLDSRVRQLELSLERWRWMREDLGETHVLVNVPTFRLQAVEDGRIALQMRVVTGTPRTPTPVFSDTMETVVLSPYWNVPSSILKGEVIPGVNKDPSYLAKKGMEVLRNGQPVSLSSVSLRDPGVRVRQRPGASNSLGQVKFLFPNEFDVYMHDTPADALFARSARAYSHGCVRLEQPYEFAQWALRYNAEWNAENILAGMNSGREKHVRLERHIPVYIVYQTAWVEDDGTVLFAHDVYKHDERQARLLPAASGGASMDTVAAR